MKQLPEVSRLSAMWTVRKLGAFWMVHPPYWDRMTHISERQQKRCAA